MIDWQRIVSSPISIKYKYKLTNRGSFSFNSPIICGYLIDAKQMSNNCILLSCHLRASK